MDGMFSIFKSLNLNKILSGANKTVSFVTKAIPTYKQVRPMVGNFKNIVNIIKNKPVDNKISNRPIPLKIKKEERNTLNNTLTFFQ